MSIINAQNAARLVAANTHLIPAANWKGSGHALAAKNIKAELARAFPGVKFSVRSDSFSMGNSVDVSWTDGPTTAEVDAIIGKYEHSSFDGMTDSSSPVCSDWHVFGSTKYAQSHRHIDDARYVEVAEMMGYPGATMDRGEMHGERIDRHVSNEIKRQARATSYYCPAVKTEIKATPSPVVPLRIASPADVCADHVKPVDPLEVCRMVVRELGRCLNADGSWDCPSAAAKRMMYDAAKKAIA